MKVNDGQMQQKDIKVCLKCNNPRSCDDFEVMQVYKSKKTGKLISYTRNVCNFCRKEAWKKIYRRVHLDNEYGISEQKYNEMVIKQSSHCNICGKLMSKPNIDHNHKTGKIRALLCSKCNLGLHFIENKEFLIAAEIYLWQHNDEEILETK